jgi:hypothetical protein
MNIFKGFNFKLVISVLDRLLNVTSQCVLVYFIVGGFCDLYQSSSYFGLVKYISFIILLFMAFIYLNRERSNA